MQDTFQQEILNIFGTTDLDILRTYAESLPGHTVKNPRNAGRKPQVSLSRQVLLLEEYRRGKTMAALAEETHACRQTISAYLAGVQSFEDLPETFTMRINYMHGSALCTVIFADFRNEQIRIHNYTDDFLLRAFGVVEHPGWEDFTWLLQERCLPAARAGLKQALRKMDVPFYDPLLIIEKTQGRMAGDRDWMQVIHRKSEKKKRKTTL